MRSTVQYKMADKHAIGFIEAAKAGKLDNLKGIWATSENKKELLTALHFENHPFNNAISMAVRHSAIVWQIWEWANSELMDDNDAVKDEMLFWRDVSGNIIVRPLLAAIESQVPEAVDLAWVLIETHQGRALEPAEKLDMLLVTGPKVMCCNLAMCKKLLTFALDDESKKWIFSIFASIALIQYCRGNQVDEINALIALARTLDGAGLLQEIACARGGLAFAAAVRRGFLSTAQQIIEWVEDKEIQQKFLLIRNAKVFREAWDRDGESNRVDFQSIDFLWRLTLHDDIRQEMLCAMDDEEEDGACPKKLAICRYLKVDPQHTIVGFEYLWQLASSLTIPEDTKKALLESILITTRKIYHRSNGANR